MKKKKRIYGSLIIMLWAPTLFFYIDFNGNAVSDLFSKQALDSYLAKTYLNEPFHILDGFFNLKIGGYTYEGEQVASEKGFEFEVTGALQPKVAFDAKRDTSLRDRLENEASEEIRELLIKDVPDIIHVEVQLDSLTGTLDSNTKWSKTGPLAKPMHIHMMIQADGKTKKDVANTMKAIQQLLNANHYVYDSVTINANIVEGQKMPGYVKFSGSFTSNKTIREKDIQQLSN